MRKVAVTTAAVGFFVLAIVGSFSGVPPFVCGLRALAGAGVLYVLMILAGRAVLTIIVDTIVKAGLKKSETGKGKP